MGFASSRRFRNFDLTPGFSLKQLAEEAVLIREEIPRTLRRTTGPLLAGGVAILAAVGGGFAAGFKEAPRTFGSLGKIPGLVGDLGIGKKVGGFFSRISPIGTAGSGGKQKIQVDVVDIPTAIPEDEGVVEVFGDQSVRLAFNRGGGASGGRCTCSLPASQLSKACRIRCGK